VIASATVVDAGSIAVAIAAGLLPRQRT